MPVPSSPNISFFQRVIPDDLIGIISGEHGHPFLYHVISVSVVHVSLIITPAMLEQCTTFNRPQKCHQSKIFSPRGQ